MSAHFEKSSSPECMFASLHGKKVARWKKPPASWTWARRSPQTWASSKDLYIVFRNSPHAWLHCLGVLVWQSDANVANCVCTEVGSTRVSGGNQERFSTRNTSSWHATLSRIRRTSNGSVAKNVGSTSSWRTSVHARRERWRGASALHFFGLDPLEANWFTSWSRLCFRFSGILIAPPSPTNTLFLTSIDLTQVDTWHRPRLPTPPSSRSTARISSFGRRGRRCGWSFAAATHGSACNLLTHCNHDLLAHNGRVSQRAECLCNASRVCQPFRPVNHCLERVWEHVHEIHNCWLVPTLSGMRMCVKKVPRTFVFRIKYTNECHVQNRPSLLLVLSTRINWWSHQQQRFRIVYQFLILALLKSHFVKSCIVGPLSFPSTTATSFPLAPFR